MRLRSTRFEVSFDVYLRQIDRRAHRRGIGQRGVGACARADLPSARGNNDYRAPHPAAPRRIAGAIRHRRAGKTIYKEAGLQGEGSGRRAGVGVVVTWKQVGHKLGLFTIQESA